MRGARWRGGGTSAHSTCCMPSSPGASTPPTRGARWGRRSSVPARRCSAGHGPSSRDRWGSRSGPSERHAELARRLDSAYAGGPVGAALERARTTVFGWARTQLTGPVGQSLETYDWRWFARAPLNNAVVIAQRLYRMNLNLFEEVYVHANANLRETIRAIQVRVFTQPGQDPYQALYSRPGLAADD